jgi:hypothetical protein
MPRLLRQINLDPVQHKPTGRTLHREGTRGLPRAHELKIVQFEGDAGYYLLHIDSNGEEITDTYHPTLEDAMKQAEWEYRVRNDEWRNIEIS